MVLEILGEEIFPFVSKLLPPFLILHFFFVFESNFESDFETNFKSDFESDFELDFESEFESNF